MLGMRGSALTTQNTGARLVIMDMSDAIARIEQRQADVRRFAAETGKPDRVMWPFAIGAMIVGAALFGAGMMAARMILA